MEERTWAQRSHRFYFPPILSSSIADSCPMMMRMMTELSVYCRTNAGHTVSNIAVSADGQHFACSSGRRVHLVDVLAQDVEGSR